MQVTGGETTLVHNYMYQLLTHITGPLTRLFHQLTGCSIYQLAVTGCDCVDVVVSGAVGLADFFVGLLRIS